MKKRFTLFNDPEFVVGRKAISDYLGVSWRTILRWKRDYGIRPLFYTEINGYPVLIKSVVQKWFFLCDESIRKYREQERMTKDCQTDDK